MNPVVVVQSRVEFYVMILYVYVLEIFYAVTQELLFLCQNEGRFLELSRAQRARKINRNRNDENVNDRSQACIFCEFSIQSHYSSLHNLAAQRGKLGLDQWGRERDRSRGAAWTRMRKTWAKGTLVLQNIKGSVGKLKGFVWK
jgi:hypothetical protein